MGLDLSDSVIDITHFLLCCSAEVQNAALLNSLTELYNSYYYFKFFF